MHGETLKKAVVSRSLPKGNILSQVLEH